GNPPVKVARGRSGVAARAGLRVRPRRTPTRQPLRARSERETASRRAAPFFGGGQTACARGGGAGGGDGRRTGRAAGQESQPSGTKYGVQVSGAAGGSTAPSVAH